MTPFSGISLLLHLVIIGVAKAYYYLSGRPETEPLKPKLIHAHDAHNLRRFASCMIIAACLAMMVASFGRAVKTSIREGAREPQIQFVKKQVAAVKDFHWGELFENEEEINAPTPTPGTSTYTFDK